MTIIYSSKPLYKRIPRDLYVTPTDLCRAALTLTYDIDPYQVLDPGCGTGHWGIAAKGRWPECQLTGVDLKPKVPQEVYGSLFTEDYLKWSMAPGYDLICGNPPGSLAEMFVRKSLALLNPKGELIFLLRLAFLESGGRAKGLWAAHPPFAVYILAERIAWQNHPKGKKGKTDDTAFALYHWRNGTKVAHPQLRWLSWR